MEQTIPLQVATDHFRYAAERGMDAGRFQEHQRIIQVLKQAGHYDAVLAIKKHDTDKKKK